LIQLGVNERAIAVVHNGTRPLDDESPVRMHTPCLVVLGRLVPHKRVEHAMEAVASLRPEFPGLTLTVIGEGWWRPELEAAAVRLGVGDCVTFTGFVDEQAKEELLSRSWLMLAPSVKEGWGLMVVEAASHGVPSIAYRSAGGLAESIVDGCTGILVGDDVSAFIDATRRVLSDDLYRAVLGQAAREHVAGYSWRTASTSMHLLLRRAANLLPPTNVSDPTAAPNQRSTEGVRIDRGPDGSLVVDLRDTAREAGRTIDLTDELADRD
jgi:glycosyltransferase involved in cell wall biosynthesis